MGDADDLVATLSSASLAIPPMLGLEKEIRAQGRWQWGTQPCDRKSLYMYEVNGVLALLFENHELFMLSHGGHGVNSYGLNLVLSKGPLAGYVQHSYGGIYADPTRDKEQIATTYTRLRALWDNLADTPGPPCWLLLHSSFRRINTVIDLPPVRAGATWQAHREDFPDEAALFAAASGLR